MEHDHAKLYDKVKFSKKDAVAIIEGEITLDAIGMHMGAVLRDMQREFKHPGFRPGNVPEEIVRKEIGEATLFEEGANAALKHAYPHLIHEYGLVPLTYPRVEVRKFVLGSPLEFKIEVGIVPEFKLPNYKSLGKELPKEKSEVKDEEIAQVIKELETARSKDETPFALTDETVKQIGKFETVEDFKTKLREHLAEEKEEAAKMNRREELGKRLLEKTPFELPAYWAEDERAAILGELEDHAGRHKTTKDAILKGYKKTEEEFLKEELSFREKNEKMKMILERIAKEEKIEPDEAEVEREAMQLRMYYQEADYERLKQVAKTALLRQKALEFIENAS
jgi:FKBP-type peptidyl-prolyl cis-trans isomerase (trigger factor)